MEILKKYYKKIRTTQLARVFVQRAVYILTVLIFKTYRLKVDAEQMDMLASTPKGIFYFWHQQIIGGMFFFSKMKFSGACIVSPSNDGRIAGHVCERLGFKVLYGSPFKNPITVLRHALTELKISERLCLVGDGSRGPAFILQPGLEYLAQKTGQPLIFIEVKASSAVTFWKSWDTFKLPLPFSTISIKVHTPRYVCTSPTAQRV